MKSFFLVALLGTVASLPAAEFYVAPNGSPSGNGSISSPWDMQTALSHPSSVRPGDTIWLRGGTYYGPFTSTLNGTASAPIIVRSYKGEWAKVDGSGTTTLTSSLPASGTASCSVADATSIPDGATIQVDAEQVYLVGKQGNSFTCYRGWNGTPVASHSAGSKALRLGNIMQVQGSYVWYWGFEITCSRTERQVRENYRGTGLNFTKTGVGNKAINMVIHNAGHPGIGFWNQGDGGEIYGSLIWNNGVYDPVFGDQKTLESMRRGSAIYAENQTGTVQIGETIAFRNMTNGFHLSATNAAVDNFTVTGNVVFDNSTGELFANGGDVNPMKNLKMIGNFAYVRPTSMNNTARLGYGLHSDMIFQNNYIVGGANPAVLVQNWTTSINITGNTVVGQNYMVGFSPNGAAVTWDNNKYYTPFVNAFGMGSSSYTFAGWQTSAGYDRNGSFSSATPPNAIFVRPNKYEPGRGHIVVYNWSMASSVNVDLSSVLTPGATYEIRDAQNYFGAPLVSGTYNGGTVAVPMTSTAIAPLVGTVSTMTSSHTSAQFGAFVILSNSSTPSTPPADTTAPTISAVTAGGVTNSGATITWTTNEAADTQVQYGTTISYGSSSALNSAQSASHSVTLSGLTADTTYNYRVLSRDAAGNLATSANFTFKTAAPAAQPPVISAVAAGSITQSGATITWTTDKAADGQVLYGSTPAYGSTAAASGMITSHSISLSGLAADTTYNFQVRSCDSAGNAASSTNFTFRTAAAPAAPQLTISGIGVRNITANSAVVYWTTNVPAVSQVVYGTTTSYGSTSAATTTYSTSHAITLTGLAANTTYNFRAGSRDADNNPVGSANYTFKTAAAADTTAPAISNIKVSSITANSAVITWTTNEASDSVVVYGRTTSYGSSASVSGMVTTHSVKLTGLSRMARYNFQVQSRDAAGNQAKSANVTFTTKWW